MRIFADREMRQQFDLSAGHRQLVERRKRDQHFVTDAMNIDDNLRRQNVDQFAMQECNHALVIGESGATGKNYARVIAGADAVGDSCLLSTFDLRPLVSYFSRRGGGKTSGVASLKPAFDWK